MLATVLDLVSNVGMGKNGKKGNEMAGMVQMAMNLLNQPNKNEEKNMSDQKPPKIAGRGASASKNKRWDLLPKLRQWGYRYAKPSQS